MQPSGSVASHIAVSRSKAIVSAARARAGTSTVSDSTTSTEAARRDLANIMYSCRRTTSPDEPNRELGLPAGARPRRLAEGGGRGVGADAGVGQVDGVGDVEQLRDELGSPIAADAHALARAQIEAGEARAVDGGDRREIQRRAPGVDQPQIEIAIALIA